MTIFVKKDIRELEALHNRLKELRDNYRMFFHISYDTRHHSLIPSLFVNRYRIIILRLDKDQPESDLEISDMTYKEAMRYLDGVAMGHMIKSIQDVTNVI
jgi:hypothetical protein